MGSTRVGKDFVLSIAYYWSFVGSRGMDPGSRPYPIPSNLPLKAAVALPVM